ncbi:MAG: C39 family peptidase [Chloroflexota bacterium]|nr:C39 family peptidase [Chloroflexota bacterium]
MGPRAALGAVLATLLLTLALPGAASAADWYRPGPRRLIGEPVYRTQRDGSRFAGSNCGPAVLGMVLDAYGSQLSTLELREKTHTYQGTWPNRGGTALQHIAHVADDLAVPVHGLYDSPDAEFHRWSVDEVVDEIDRGRWVIPLVRYAMLPGHEASGVRTGHYIVLYRNEGDGFVYHDPAFDPVEQGRARWISRDQLDRAMNPVLVPRQALALGK